MVCAAKRAGGIVYPPALVEKILRFGPRVHCMKFTAPGRRHYCQLLVLLPATVRHVCCASVPACRVQRAVRPTPNPHVFAQTCTNLAPRCAPLRPLLPTTPKQTHSPRCNWPESARQDEPSPHRQSRVAHFATERAPSANCGAPPLMSCRICQLLAAHIPGHEQRSRTSAAANVSILVPPCCWVRCRVLKPQDIYSSAMQ